MRNIQNIQDSWSRRKLQERWSVKLLTAVMLGLLLFGFATVAGAAEDTLLPKVELVVPESEAQRDLLGLTGKAGDFFDAAEIDADVLLIEIFSMYCPHCQREAPNVNTLYAKIGQLQGSAPRVRLIGVGAANSDFEVEHFQKTYGIKFPLFSDPDMTVYKALHAKGTPSFIGVRLEKGKSPRIVLHKSGRFEDPADFLEKLLHRAGY